MCFFLFLFPLNCFLFLAVTRLSKCFHTYTPKKPQKLKIIHPPEITHSIYCCCRVLNYSFFCRCVLFFLFLFVPCISQFYFYHCFSLYLSLFFRTFNKNLMKNPIPCEKPQKKKNPENKNKCHCK